jgi:hypothetical protein
MYDQLFKHVLQVLSVPLMVNNLHSRAGFKILKCSAEVGEVSFRENVTIHDL